MKIFCEFLTVNKSKLHFLLVICIAKNLLWTTLKAGPGSHFFHFFFVVQGHIFDYNFKCSVLLNITFKVNAF